VVCFFISPLGMAKRVFLKDLNRKLLGTSLTLDCPMMMYLWQQMRTQAEARKLASIPLKPFEAKRS